MTTNHKPHLTLVTNDSDPLDTPATLEMSVSFTIQLDVEEGNESQAAAQAMQYFTALFQRNELTAELTSADGKISTVTCGAADLVANAGLEVALIETAEG